MDLEHLEEQANRFMPYLEDIRKRLYRVVILFSVLFITGFFGAARILKFVIGEFHIDGVTIAVSSPFQFANLAMDIGFFVALVVCIPYGIYTVYSFISPALISKEKNVLLRSVPYSVGLFLFGFLYGFAVLYYALELLAQVNISIGIQNIWDITEFISQMFLTATLLGVLFEFPIIITILLRFNIIEVQFLKDKRKLAHFLTFCFVSLLPPTDGLSLVIMSLPLVILYEVTILLNNNNKITC